MLVLTRKPGEKIVVPVVGLTITVLNVDGKLVRLGFEAPESCTILRGEIELLSSRGIHLGDNSDET